MSTQRIRRTAAASFAAVALAAAGAGIAAVGTGAIAFGGSGGAAIVTHTPGFRTVTLQPGASDLMRAAKDTAYDEQICSSNWLAGYPNCATDLQRCAARYATSSLPVEAVFYEPRGNLGSCKPVS
jgi:hypothetical protein